MPHSHAPRSGGQILIDSLRAQGADTVFCVAGESYLEALDAFVDARDAIRVVTCRQEGGAGFMAEAWGKMTGKPGVCFVTRGPGACNASIAVHTAMQDSTPMILFVGQVARDQEEREAFQEIDYRRMFAYPVAKWAAQIDGAARIPEFVARAFHVATSGRPGPVVLALPEDMLRETASVPDAGRYAATQAHPGAADLARLREMLAAAERPLVLAGGSLWSDAASADLRRFAEANALPVCVSFRRQDAMDNDSDSYVGVLDTGPNPKLLERVRKADLLLALGARLGEITTQGYGLIDAPETKQTLIHVHPNAEELGRVFRPDLAMLAGSAEIAAALADMAPVDGGKWAAWTAEARADFLAFQEPNPMPGDLDLNAIFAELRNKLPKDAIVTTDAGNFSGWAARFLRYRRPGRQLGPTSGAMGYGVPSAVAAAIRHPDRLVIGMMGDGGFMMTGQELATAMQAGAAPIFFLFNNGMYGTIRMHQEKRFPGRISATDLTNPDFAALARSYGAFGVTVEKTEDFWPAFEAARASGKPAIVELRYSQEIVSSRMTLTKLREAAMAK